MKLTTVKRLFGVAGNTCAFPNCTTPLVKDGVIVGEICHIRAQEPGGPRYVADYPDLDAYENLILMCGVHHKIIDTKPEEYSIKMLEKLKWDHEDRFQQPSDDALQQLTININEGSIVTSRNQMGGQIAHQITNIYQYLSTLPAPTQAMPKNNPEIECLVCFIADMGQTDTMKVVDGKGCPTILADFRMKPVADSEPWVEVRSHITFHDRDLETRWRVKDGIWLHSDKIQIAFHRGETKTLILALLSPNGVVAYEHHMNEPGRNRKNTYLKPLIKPLNDDHFFIEVELIGAYLDQLRLNRRFWYQISKSPEWEIRQVTDEEMRM